MLEIKKTKYEPDKLEPDEFAVRNIAIGDVESGYVRDTFEKLGTPLGSKMVLLSVRRWNRKRTEYITVRRCIVVTVRQLEEALPRVYRMCKNSFFSETNPAKYNRYKFMEKIYNKAKKAYENKMRKDKPIFDDIYEEIRNDD